MKNIILVVGTESSRMSCKSRVRLGILGLRNGFGSKIEGHILRECILVYCSRPNSSGEALLLREIFFIPALKMKVVSATFLINLVLGAGLPVEQCMTSFSGGTFMGVSCFYY